MHVRHGYVSHGITQINNMAETPHTTMRLNVDIKKRAIKKAKKNKSNLTEVITILLEQWLNDNG